MKSQRRKVSPIDAGFVVRVDLWELQKVVENIPHFELEWKYSQEVAR